MKQQDQDQLRTAATLQDSRWASVLTRDPEADGVFFYSVQTTGVYCRPSCAARLPRPENVAFHATSQDAEGAGFRPCKRCKPEQLSLNERRASIVAEACRSIEGASQALTLQQLATAAHLSPFHFQRLFRATLGLTPKQYFMAHRSKTLRKHLAQSETITRAIYDSGFNSNARFYATSNKALGMTPSSFRKGGEDVDISFAVGECTLGSFLVAQSSRGICAIHLGDDPGQLISKLRERFPRATLKAGDAAFNQLVAKVVGLVEAPDTNPGLPLDIRGTAFQQQVWEALRALPYGSTATYQEIANAIGMPKSVRAVAQACAANNLAVAVPCHRVVRSDGSPSGYRWGVERKKLLLQRERSGTGCPNRSAIIA